MIALTAIGWWFFLGWLAARVTYFEFQDVDSILFVMFFCGVIGFGIVCIAAETASKRQALGMKAKPDKNKKSLNISKRLLGVK